MKKCLMPLFIIFAMFIFVSCIEDEDDLDDFADTESGSADSDPDDHSNQDTTPEDNNSDTDTDSDTNHDPDPSDTTDSDSNPVNDQGGETGNGDNTNPGTNPGDGTNPGTNPGDNTDSGTNPGDNTDPGTTVEEEEDDYDYEKCIEITLDTKMEYDYWDLGLMAQGGTIYRTSYDPRTGSDPEKQDYLNFEFYNTGRYLTGGYNLAGKDYSSYYGLFLVVYEDGGAKNYINRKGRVRVTTPTPNSSSITIQLTDAFLEEVTIDKSTHVTTVVPDGACLKVNDTSISE